MSSIAIPTVALSLSLAILGGCASAAGTEAPMDSEQAPANGTEDVAASESQALVSRPSTITVCGVTYPLTWSALPRMGEGAMISQSITFTQCPLQPVPQALGWNIWNCPGHVSAYDQGGACMFLEDLQRYFSNQCQCWGKF
jgi:hypothetical protein